jgi:hypothetical protein
MIQSLSDNNISILNHNHNHNHNHNKNIEENNTGKNHGTLTTSTISTHANDLYNNRIYNHKVQCKILYFFLISSATFLSTFIIMFPPCYRPFCSSIKDEEYVQCTSIFDKPNTTSCVPNNHYNNLTCNMMETLLQRNKREEERDIVWFCQNKDNGYYYISPFEIDYQIFGRSLFMFMGILDFVCISCLFLMCCFKFCN